MIRSPGAYVERLLEFDNLTIGFGDNPPAVEGASFDIRRGEIVAVVGESGSGKTLSCRAALGILPPGGRILGGSIRFFAENLTKKRKRPSAAYVDLAAISERQLRKMRGNRMTMIFQEPMSALSPLHTIGAQTVEMLQLHRRQPYAMMKARCLEMYDRVGFPDPARAWRSYPFELSGGMRQRAMIAMAMVVEPDLLIADEPTTALDVTTQAQVLSLISELQRETGMGVAFVTHDLGVVSAIADQVVVMRRGKVVETGPTADIIHDPHHGYSKKLLAAAPRTPDAFASPRSDEDYILEARDLRKTYALRNRGWGGAQEIQALRGVDITVARGRTTAIVGESGSGKSTMARLALGGEAPDPGGAVAFRFEPGAAPVYPSALSSAALKRFRATVQMVMQDPFAALSPRLTVNDILCEPFEIHNIADKRGRRDKAVALMEKVGLSASMLDRYPHAFSGGQRQRISIARALALEPKMLICDEPTSALDVSVQAQVLALLKQIRDENGLSYLFISHDLAVVASLADQVVVMRQGRVVESGPPGPLFETPKHPYTIALMAASPEPDERRGFDIAAVSAGAGAPSRWPEAFRFEGDDAPPLNEIEPHHWVRQHA